MPDILVMVALLPTRGIGITSKVRVCCLAEHGSEVPEAEHHPELAVLEPLERGAVGPAPSR